jgi:hypothetical protein
MNISYKLHILLIALIFSFDGLVSAQKVSFDDVLNISLKNSGPIFSESQVAGYYFFYKVDKVDKKTNEFLLKILDANLNEVASKSLIESKQLYLLEGSFNNETIMLKFLNRKTNELVYKEFDSKANLVKSIVRPVDNKVIKGMGIQSEQTTLSNDLIFPINNVGYIDQRPTIKHGELELIPTDENVKGWTYQYGKDRISTAMHVISNNDISLFNLSKRDNLLSNKLDLFLVAIDNKTGNEIFEKSLRTKMYEIVLTNAYFNENDSEAPISIVGLFYPKNSKVAKEESLGLFSISLDASGEMVNEKFIKWQSISDKLPVNQEKKLIGNQNLYFHNIFRDEDGKIFAIAEQFKKTIDAAGIAVNLLTQTNDAGGTKIVIEDMVLLSFSSQFDLEHVEVFEKSKSHFNMPPGSGLFNANFMGNYVKAMGGFDYSYTQHYPSSDKFTVAFLDYKKIKGEKNKWIFGAITNVDGKNVFDEISLESDASSLQIFPAKPGYVLITEYMKKSSKLDSRLEPINY